MGVVVGTRVDVAAVVDLRVPDHEVGAVDDHASDAFAGTVPTQVAVAEYAVAPRDEHLAVARARGPFGVQVLEDVVGPRHRPFAPDLGPHRRARSPDEHRALGRSVRDDAALVIRVVGTGEDDHRSRGQGGGNGRARRLGCALRPSLVRAHPGVDVVEPRHLHRPGLGRGRRHLANTEGRCGNPQGRSPRRCRRSPEGQDKGNQGAYSTSPRRRESSSTVRSRRPGDTPGSRRGRPDGRTRGVASPRAGRGEAPRSPPAGGRSRGSR